MDQLEMIEKLRSKANVSYKDAKETLESCDWNLLDAMIKLEEEGKISGHSTERSDDSKKDDASGTEYSTKRNRPKAEEFRQNFDEENVKSFFKRFWEKLQDLMSAGNRKTVRISHNEKEIMEISVTILVIIILLALMSFKSMTFLLLVWIASLLFGVNYEFLDRRPHEPGSRRRAAKRSAEKAENDAEDDADDKDDKSSTSKSSTSKSSKSDNK